MPTTKSYRQLHDRVAARPGAAERLAELRQETLAEMGLYELRGALQQSQADLAAAIGITQSAVSQFERGDDIMVSTLRNYLKGLGATLRISAVFDNGESETVIPIQLESNMA